MFKLESYITPLLLSYVDKYIKNFRPEDSQVSLWGGDASFHNLDLRLEVLEQELQLPFSFVSGHIHELLIHVPWTKLASEPITITINTIECILKLRGTENLRTPDTSQKDRQKKSINKRNEVEAPSGYVQSLVNKIVSNITIYCNNLILKYVEEDIVLSMNVKLLTFESANEKWEPAYTDYFSAQITMRKLITVNDLTVCLDKRNSSGKIDVYQEPMLYRCSLVVHMLRNYHTATSKKASTTRLDVYCNNMEFSMTEQQIPMLMRLILLLCALKGNEFKGESETSTGEDNFDISGITDNNISWAGWAWSFVPSILPVNEQTDEEQPVVPTGHTLHIGFFVDNASLTFKVSEYSTDRSYYSQKKLKYWPVLLLRLQGLYNQFIMHGLKWINVSAGIGQILLTPLGSCTCSYIDVTENIPSVEYISAGSVCDSHKTDSLFDAEAVENKGQKKLYNISWDYHMSHITESTLLDKTPAIAIDYVYELTLPDDMTSEQLSDLSSEYEYSNVSIRTLLRIVVGPCRLRLCSGLIHRLRTIKAAASAYEYAPYTRQKPTPSLMELHPPSEDDYDALNGNIPMSIVQYTVIAPVIEFQLFDHPFFEPTKEYLFKKRKKISTSQSASSSSPPYLPKLTLECQCIDAKIQCPIYTKRLIQTVCQLPDPPKHMFDACYKDISIKLIGFCSRLILSSNRHTTIIMPFNATCNSKNILSPNYWTEPDIAHSEMNIISDGITITVTKPKALVIVSIIDKLKKMNCEDVVRYLSNTSLLNDASNDCRACLEFCVEDSKFKKVVTSTTLTVDVSLGAVKAFIFDPVEISSNDAQLKNLTSIYSKSTQSIASANYYLTREIQQVLFISGPEYRDDSVRNDDAPLLKIIMQFPLDPSHQYHPPILMFNLQEIRICIDPLLCRWALYMPTVFQQKPDFIHDTLHRKSKTISETSGSITDTPRRTGTALESVHSSSDRDLPNLPLRIQKITKEEDIPDLQERIYTFLKKWFSVWKGMLLFGDISQCTIYFPVKSLSAIGSQGIQQAVDEIMKKENPPDILVITLPNARFRSATNKESLMKYIKNLPVKLPSMIWSTNKSNFPWNISVSDISCYSWQNGKKFNFLKPVSLNATVGLCTKTRTGTKISKSGSNTSTNVHDNNSPELQDFQSGTSIGSSESTKFDISSLGICVHVDMTPTNIIMSEVQICLVASMLYGLIEVYNNCTFEAMSEPLKSADILPIITTHSTTTSPTVLKESTLESVSEQVSHIILNSESTGNEDIKLTAWIQWTVTRFSIELLSYKIEDLLSENFSYTQQSNLKLVIEAEDIVSSLDFQSVYLKIKSKVGSASIQHYLLDKGKWKPGPFLGLIMRTREDITMSDKHEDTSFANIIITRASCQHTHNLWGTSKKSKEKKSNSKVDQNTRFITEIVVTMQPIDFLLPPIILQSFYMVFEPLLQIHVPLKSSKISNISLHVNNTVLPLAHLECKGFRIIIPSSELENTGAQHDVCIFQVDSVNLVPEPANPICRSPIRPDIYQQAARARILNIPGSDIEDRQYELVILGISCSTSTWEEFDPILNIHSSGRSRLKTMSENPALEWNMGKSRLGNKQNISLWPFINKFDLLIITAPAMIHNNDVICGHSIEINFVSNIEMNMSISQIKLATALHNEINTVIDLISSNYAAHKRPKVYIPYIEAKSHMFDAEESYSQDHLDGFRDSGFETSDFKSSLSLKTKESSQIRKISESDKSVNIFSKSISSTSYFIPLDILITAGKISLVLYQFESGSEKLIKTTDYIKVKPLLKDFDREKGYEGSEEGSIDERHVQNFKKFQPLMFISISQPNIYLSDLQLGRKIQLSCFDISIKTSGSEYQALRSIPLEKDFPVLILETRSGVPNPNTGVLPAFFTLKWSKGIGKPNLDIEIAKPTKLLCSVERWIHLLNIKAKILQTLYFLPTYQKKIPSRLKTMIRPKIIKTQKSVDGYSKFKKIKKHLRGVSILNVKFAQVVLSFNTENNAELNLCIGKVKNHLNVSNRPEKVTNVMTLDSVTLGVHTNEISQLVLNPWTISVDVSLFWESWQSIDSNPQIQISAESDCIMVDISPQQLKCIELVKNEVTEFLYNFLWDNVTLEDRVKECHNIPPSDKEQHYKDDLRAGAFHFVDSNSNNIEELPLPYQVMFWNRNIAAMAWRYPQPRALTKIRVFPIPFKMTTGNQDDQQILCHLEFWSDCHGYYQPYTQFYLSESEMCHLDLPQNNNQPAVACIWRVVLSTHDNLDDDYNHSRVLISPRALAGCIRVDSYFNKVLIPELTMALHISSISISLYSHIDKHLPFKMPECLTQYVSDLIFPKNQCFLTITLENTKAYLATWNFETVAFDVGAITKCNILDYGFLTQQPLLEPFASKLEVYMSKSLNINFVSKPIHFKFGASAAHTLAVSAQMWEENWKNKHNSTVNLIIMTHYVICNDTNVNLRFGQAGYEDILLPSRNCHLYSWRSQKFKQMIRVALEEFQWVWSEPFRIDKDGTEICKITDDNVVIFVTIKSLSTTQKQVIFSGQLILFNTLIEHFELKVVEAVEKDKDKEFKNAVTHIINGKSTPPSILINSSKKYFLRLRFFGLESAWSGDIPLMENTKCAQPWLVKVPLQERGQFLSIWCKVITQHFSKATKVLVIFWPLFMVRSNLPISSKVHIETPTLNVHLESTVRGKGEYQQLYCPGTIDHSHQLTFQLDDTPTSNPYVPLNYSLVDQKQFFKKSDKEDINEILSILSTYEKPCWPYFNEDFDGLDYVIEEQPLTHVQVRYQNACEHSSALLVELLPWCLILNTLGCSIAVIINEKELCRISHYGICTPPKLEETFYLGIGIGGTWNLTLPLQLAKSDWSQAFYMPKITGTIPMDGSIKTLVKCDPYVCMVSINSSIVNEIRLLKISSPHVITNNMSLQVYAVCFAVPDNGTCYNIPKKIDKHAFRIAPHLHKSNSGISIIQWYVVGKLIDANSEYLFYVSFSINPKLGWSCPIQVDKNFMRRSISVQAENKSIPIVLLSREYKGQLFLSLHHDIHPQLLIENKSGIKLFCAQYVGEENNFILDDCKHLKWLCTIDNESSTYYTMPIVSEKFPDILQNNYSENLVFASDPEGDPQGFQWSNPIDVTNFNDQFVRIPFYGDVKVCILNTAHTTVVVIESVSQVEISARDIRVRLSMHENEYLSSLDISKQTDAITSQDLLDAKTDVMDDETIASTYFSAEEAPQSLSNSNLAHNKQFLYESQTLPTLVEKSNINFDLPDSLSSLDIDLSGGEPKTRKEWNNLKILMFFKCVTFTLTSDLENGGTEKTEILALTCDDIGLSINRSEIMEVNLSISEIQLDNQLYFRGSYDFPVVLIGQNTTQIQPLNSLNVSVNQLIKNAQDNALIFIKANFEIWEDHIQQINITDVTDIRISIKPLATFIEDTYITKLIDFLNVLTPTKLVLWPQNKNYISFAHNTVLVAVPEHISWESSILAKPLVLRNFSIDAISVLLSVHSSIKLYIALDQSPLHFGKFEKKYLLTTSYRLGHAITMHYLSGAIFGAGWVVGSLELLGSPGGLARAMGNGLRDFVSLPYRGLLQGPWAFLIGVTHGSASLMRHVTAGTLQSVTKLASSVARNLDRLTLDEEHLQRTEEQRRQRPQGLAQGFIQGLTGLGISLLGAVGGIAHHPLQSVMSEGASPRSLVTGVGLGLVGVFTKPLSGAADLLALTGQGLLQGAGWNPLPEARTKPTLCHTYSSINSEVKYQWKFMLPFTKTNILFVTEATCITNYGQYEAVALILTIDTLIIINTDEDMSQRILKLSELNGIENMNDPTLLTLKLSLPKLSATKPKNEDECIELDPASRARIADYVKNTVGLMHFSDSQSSEHSEISISPDISGEDTADEAQKEQTTFMFYVNPQSRNYFLCLLSLAKQQHETYNFPVL